MPNPSGTLSKSSKQRSKNKNKTEIKHWVHEMYKLYSQTPVQLWLCSQRLQTLPSLCSCADLPSERDPHALIFHSMVWSSLVNTKCIWNAFTFDVVNHDSSHYSYCCIAFTLVCISTQRKWAALLYNIYSWERFSVMRWSQTRKNLLLRGIMWGRVAASIHLESKLCILYVSLHLLTFLTELLHNMKVFLHQCQTYLSFVLYNCIFLFASILKIESNQKRWSTC